MVRMLTSEIRIVYNYVHSSRDSNRGVKRYCHKMMVLAYYENFCYIRLKVIRYHLLAVRNTTKDKKVEVERHPILKA